MANPAPSADYKSRDISKYFRGHGAKKGTDPTQIDHFAPQPPQEHLLHCGCLSSREELMDSVKSLTTTVQHLTGRVRHLEQRCFDLEKSRDIIRTVERGNVARVPAPSPRKVTTWQPNPRPVQRSVKRSMGSHLTSWLETEDDSEMKTSGGTRTNIIDLEESTESSEDLLSADSIYVKYEPYKTGIISRAQKTERQDSIDPTRDMEVKELFRLFNTSRSGGGRRSSLF